MAQSPTKPQHVPTGLADRGDDVFPAQWAIRRAAGPRLRVRTHAVGQVAVLEVAGRLSDVVEDLDREIRLALAEGPRGVVCDLSEMLEGAAQGALEVLASAGRHVRDWPLIPVAVACADPQVRDALSAHPLGGHLMVTASLRPALSAVLRTSTPVVESLRLAPHPTAPRASRDFVSRTLLDWRLGQGIPSACLVVSELVTNAMTHAGTDIDLSIASHARAIRLTVRDQSAGLPRLRRAHPDSHGRGLTTVAGLSRAWGVLPTSDGGKVVWALLDASRTRQD